MIVCPVCYIRYVPITARHYLGTYGFLQLWFKNKINQRQNDKSRNLQHPQTQLQFLRGLLQIDDVEEFETEIKDDLVYYRVAPPEYKRLSAEVRKQIKLEKSKCNRITFSKEISRKYIF